MVDFNVPKLPPAGATGRAVASAVNLLIDGKNNAKGVFTLTASAGTTVVSDIRAGQDSVINYAPVSANASAEIGAGTIYISARAKSSFTITHANNSQSDRTFVYTVTG
jgi:hypothetical protein